MWPQLGQLFGRVAARVPAAGRLGQVVTPVTGRLEEFMRPFWERYGPLAQGAMGALTGPLPRLPGADVARRVLFSPAGQMAVGAALIPPVVNRVTGAVDPDRNGIPGDQGVRPYRSQNPIGSPPPAVEPPSASQDIGFRPRQRLFSRGGEEAFDVWLRRQPGYSAAWTGNPMIQLMREQADGIGLQAQLEALTRGITPEEAYSQVMARALSGRGVFSSSSDLTPLLDRILERIQRNPDYAQDPIAHELFNLLIADPQNLMAILGSEGPAGRARALALADMFAKAQLASLYPTEYGGAGIRASRAPGMSWVDIAREAMGR